jgi:hypothetical protein
MASGIALARTGLVLMATFVSVDGGYLSARPRSLTMIGTGQGELEGQLAGHLLVGDGDGLRFARTSGPSTRRRGDCRHYLGLEVLAKRAPF